MGINFAERSSVYPHGSVAIGGGEIFINHPKDCTDDFMDYAPAPVSSASTVSRPSPFTLTR